MKSSVPDVTRLKMTSSWLIQTPTYGLPHTTHHIQIANVNLTAEVDAGTNMRSVTYRSMQQTIVTNAYLQKQLLSKYECNSNNKSQEYNKFHADKESLITILYRQCNEATQTKIALGDTYPLTTERFGT